MNECNISLFSILSHQHIQIYTAYIHIYGKNHLKLLLLLFNPRFNHIKLLSPFKGINELVLIPAIGIIYVLDLIASDYHISNSYKIEVEVVYSLSLFFFLSLSLLSYFKF